MFSLRPVKNIYSKMDIFVFHEVVARGRIYTKWGLHFLLKQVPLS